jgi:hypothetical protein
MPTLQPQTLSGLVVIPTVELDGSIYRVSIAIDVGVSRTPPPQVVTREDLIVELRNPSEGSLEAIASPDPGPLPARALRVVQARGEFTFSQGVNPPTEVVVTLRGDRRSFPMAQTFAPTGCLRGEPKEGDRFVVAPAPGGILARLRPFPFPFLRPRCCSRHFNAPLNASADPAAKSEYYEVEAHFAGQGRACRCRCCEYRQYVRGTFTDGAGAAVRFDMPSGALDSGTWCEDGAVDEFGPGSHGYYGHRDRSTPGDEYSSPDANTGCAYRANETPSCPPTDSAHVEFLGLIVDRCNRRVVAKRTWTVDL